MTFVIRVTDDGGTTRLGTDAERLVTRLESAETQAEKTGAAIARGARQGSTSLDQAAAAADRARDSVGRFARQGSTSLDQLAAAASRATTSVASFAGPALRWRSSLDAVSFSAERAVDAINRIGAPASHGQLVASLGRVGLAFEGVARAIQLEQEMYDKINGPARRYEQDLRTLDSLLGKNRISTEQYAEQVRQLNRELQRGSSISQTQRPQTAKPSGLAGLLPGGGGAGMLAGGGAAAGMLAGAGVALGVNEVLQAANTYQNLQNRMKVVAQEGETVSAVFEKVRATAIGTRSSIETTAEAYVRLRGATREMGLGTDELLKLTERINKAITLSGASSSEAAAGMMQLSQGLASGKLQGDELRSVLENLPYVADVIANSLGVTRGKLRELGEQGKLTSAVVVNAFTTAGGKIDKDFGRTAPTLGQQWTMLKDQFTVTIGKIFEATGLFKTLGSILDVVGTVVGIVGDAMGLAGDAVTALCDALGPLGDALLWLLNPLEMTKDVLGLLQDAGKGLVEVLGIGDDAATRTARAYLAQYDALKKLLDEQAKLDRVANVYDAARGAGVNVGPSFDVGTAKAAAALASNLKQTLGVDVPAAYDEATKKAIQFEAGVNKIKDQRALDETEEKIRKLAKALLGLNDVLDNDVKHWQSLDEKLADVNAALAKIAKDRADLARVTGKDPLIEMHGRGSVDALDKTRQELRLERERRDLLDEVNNREYAYGDVVVRLNKATNERKDALRDLHAAMRDGAITQTQYNEALRSLGVEEDRATKILKELREPAREWEKTIGALNALLRRGLIDAQQYNGELAKLLSSNPTRSGQLPRFSGVGGRKWGGLDVAVGYDDTKNVGSTQVPKLLSEMGIDRDRQIDTSYLNTLSDNARKVGGVMESAASKTARWKTELERLKLLSQNDGFGQAFSTLRTEITDTAGALESTLVNAFHAVENAIVELATTGEISFSKMINSMLADLTRLLMKQALAGLLGAISGGTPSVFGTGATQGFQGLFGSAPGYAHGGSFTMTGGAPGIDTNLVALRMSNNERLDITPAHGNAPAAAAAPANVTVVNVNSDDGMRSFMEREGETFVLNVMRRNEPAIRGRTTGR